MRVLVACEFSGVVREAFKAKGHYAMSCDLLPTEIPGNHHQGDIRDVLEAPWDLVIAHPPCTHLAVSGAAFFAAKRADGRQQGGIDFFMIFTKLDHVAHVAIENPVGIMSTVWRKPDQIIQPYEHGHPESKKTCLWLKGLPKLVPSCIVPPLWYKNPDGTDYKDSKGKRYSPTHFLMGRTQLARWANQTPSGQNKLGPSPDRAKIRSRTYEGIAKAMAAQWSPQETK